MKWFMALTVFLLCMTGAQAQGIDGQPYIAVHGKARTEVVPDIFPLEVTIKDTSRNPQKSQSLVEGLATRIIDMADAAGLPDPDVTVANLDVSPQYRYNEREDSQVFLGNSYTRQIKLRFRSLPALRDFIDGLPQNQQIAIDTARFESSQADAQRRELMQAAIDDARQAATAMAAGVGRGLGKVHNISNQGFNVRYVTSGQSDGFTSLDAIQVTGSRAAAPARVLREGSIALEQNVYIIYTLVD